MNKWPKKVKGIDSVLLPYVRVHYELSLQNGCILQGTHQLLVPEELQPMFIHLVHDIHQGIVWTKRQLWDLYWWPGIDSQAEEAIKAWVTSQLHNKTAVTPQHHCSQSHFHIL